MNKEEYSALLQCIEWGEKRKQILDRDDYQCRSCGNKRLFKDNHLCNLGIRPYFGKTQFIILDEKMQDQGTAIAKNIDFESFRKSLKTNQEIYGVYGKDELGIYLNCIIGLVGSLKKKIINPVKITIRSEIFKRIPELSWYYIEGLHVHHTYYQIGVFPWEYPDRSLITLCWICHIEKHSNSLIPVLDSNGKQIKSFHACKRCGGAGIIPQFKHVQGGICFRCWGARYEELITLETDSAN